MGRLTRESLLLFSCALTLALSACGGAGGAPGTARTFAYVSQPAGLLDSDPRKPFPAQIAGFDVDPQTGALTPLNGSPFPAPVVAAIRPRFIAAPDGHFLYLGGCTDLLGTGKDDCTITNFAVGSDGRLSRRATLSVSNIGTDDMQIVPSGKFMYAFDSQILRTQVLAFQIGSDGGLTPLPPVASAPGVIARIAVTPSGTFLYALVYGQPTATACTIAPGPSCQTVVLMAYSIDQNTGALTPVAGAPFPTTLQGSGNSPGAFPMIFDGQSRFLYLADEFRQDFVAFAIDATTGAPTPLPPPITRITTTNGAASPDGKFLFLGIGITSPTPEPGIAGFSIGSSGRLTPVPGSPLLFSINDACIGCPLSLDPTGGFLYFIGDGVVELKVGPGGAISNAQQAFPLPGPAGRFSSDSVLVVPRTP